MDTAAEQMDFPFQLMAMAPASVKQQTCHVHESSARWVWRRIRRDERPIVERAGTRSLHSATQVMSPMIASGAVSRAHRSSTSRSPI